MKYRLRNFLTAGLVLCCLASCGSVQHRQIISPAERLAELGYQPLFFDESVNPADSLYSFANGAWLDAVIIGNQTISRGTFSDIQTRIKLREESLVLSTITKDERVQTSDQRVIDRMLRLYANGERLNEEGLRAADDFITAILSATDKPELFRVAGHMARHGMNGFYELELANDEGRMGLYNLRLSQGGLSLPNKAYYGFSQHNETPDLRQALADFYANILDVFSDGQGRTSADDIIKFETALAALHWDIARLRDWEAQLNLMDVEAVDQRFRYGYVGDYLDGADITVPDINIAQPDFLDGLSNLIAETNLTVLKNYLLIRIVVDNREAFGDDVETAAAAALIEAVYGVQLAGSRADRALSYVTFHNAMGLGYLHERLFRKDSHYTNTIALINGVLLQYIDAVEGSDWLSESTKAQVIEKLKSIAWQIEPRAPDVPEIQLFDDSSYFITKTKLKQRRFDYLMGHLGKSFDVDLWEVPVHRVNAIYKGDVNQVTLPGGIMEIPFLTPNSPAASFGALGAIIGHEIAHAIDDRGRHRDAMGRANGAWPASDEAIIEEIYEQLSQRYADFAVAEGVDLNSDIALSENLADLMGLSIAYEAFKSAHVPSGSSPFTAEQVFFIAWAQVWRRMDRSEESLRRAIADTHAIPRFRVDGIVQHIDGFYEAFDVGPDNDLYLPEEDRIKIWQRH